MIKKFIPRRRSRAGRLLERIITKDFYGGQHLVSLDPEDSRKEREILRKDDTYMQQDWAKQVRQGFRFLYDLDAQHLYVWIAGVASHCGFLGLIGIDNLKSTCFWGYIDDDFYHTGEGSSVMYVPSQLQKTEAFKRGWQRFVQAFQGDQQISRVYYLHPDGDSDCCYGNCFDLQGWDWQQHIPVTQEATEFHAGDKVRLRQDWEKLLGRMRWLDDDDLLVLRKAAKNRTVGTVTYAPQPPSHLDVKFPGEMFSIGLRVQAVEGLPWTHSDVIREPAAMAGARRRFRQGD